MIVIVLKNPRLRLALGTGKAADTKIRADIREVVD